jgi:hypothetical protein
MSITQQELHQRVDAEAVARKEEIKEEADKASHRNKDYTDEAVKEIVRHE